MSQLPITVWIRNRKSYVESHPNVTLRIKSAWKFGQNVIGFSDGVGELVDLNWDSVLSLSPTTLEINHGNNPLGSLVKALKEGRNEEKLSSFLSRLRYLSLFGCDIQVEDLLYFLEKLELLAAFSYKDVNFGRVEWEYITKALLRLNVRALEMSGGEGALENILGALDVELLKISGAPGVTALEIANTPATFITVRTLFIADLCYRYKGDRDAEEVLAVLPTKFPRLSSLIFDWSVIDPAVVMDDRAMGIVAKLIEVYTALQLEVLTLIAYTPCGETNHGIREVARILSEQGVHEVRVLKFASKGLSNGAPNFSVVMCGRSAEKRALIEKIVVDGRNSIPSLSVLMPLLDTNTTLNQPALTVEFGGFDSASIRKTYVEKMTAKGGFVEPNFLMNAGY